MSSTALPSSLDDIAIPPELPPLVLFAFTRPELLQEVLIALQQQSLLPQQIIAFLDGARSPKDEPLIGQCIQLLEDLSRVIPVQIIRRAQNLGCDRNVILGLTEVLSSHNSIVYLEDDTVPNPHFYDRMCRLLTAYRDQDQVFSVSAYACLPEQVYHLTDHEFEASNRVFSLGFGIWADRWNAIDLANQPQRYNPFGSFYQIPATLQTKRTMTNQFWLEKNQKTDWVITMTIAALHQGKVHIVPKTSLVYNTGFGHAESKTYNNGAAPPWVNAKYDAAACPSRLPTQLELSDRLQAKLEGAELARHFAKNGLWLHPSAMLYLLRQHPGWNNSISWFKLFITRLPRMLKRWRSGLPV